MVNDGYCSSLYCIKKDGAVRVRGGCQDCRSATLQWSSLVKVGPIWLLRDKGTRNRVGLLHANEEEQE